MSLKYEPSSEPLQVPCEPIQGYLAHKKHTLQVPCEPAGLSTGGRRQKKSSSSLLLSSLELSDTQVYEPEIRALLPGAVRARGALDGGQAAEEEGQGLLLYYSQA